MTKAELIEALKEAKGPDRELDAQIALYVGWRQGYDQSGELHAIPPRYTGSYDAAMKLLPDDVPWTIVHGPPEAPGPLGFAQVRRPNVRYCTALAETPILAICIAAIMHGPQSDGSDPEPAP